jgi:hypothetical protein
MLKEVTKLFLDYGILNGMTEISGKVKIAEIM